MAGGGEVHETMTADVATQTATVAARRIRESKTERPLHLPARPRTTAI